MKQVLLLLSLLAMGAIVHAQTAPELHPLKFDSTAHYTAKTDQTALKAAQYLLSVNPSPANRAHIRTLTFLQKWMDGTPDYSFDVSTTADIVDGNEILMVIAFAGMTDYVLTHKDQKDQINKITAMGLKRAIAYAKVPRNKVKLTAGLKGAMEADTKGRLEQYVAGKRKW